MPAVSTSPEVNAEIPRQTRGFLLPKGLLSASMLSTDEMRYGIVIMTPVVKKSYRQKGAIVNESIRMRRMCTEPMQTIFAKKAPLRENNVTPSNSAIVYICERKVSNTAKPETRGISAAMPVMTSRFI